MNIFCSFFVFISSKFSKRNGKLRFAEVSMGVFRRDCDLETLRTKRNIVKSVYVAAAYPHSMSKLYTYKYHY